MCVEEESVSGGDSWNKTMEVVKFLIHTEKKLVHMDLRMWQLQNVNVENVKVLHHDGCHSTDVLICLVNDSQTDSGQTAVIQQEPPTLHKHELKHTVVCVPVRTRQMCRLSESVDKTGGWGGA